MSATATRTFWRRLASKRALSGCLIALCSLCDAAHSEPLQITAVDPEVTPIAHAAEVTLTFNQPLDLDEVALAPGGARLTANTPMTPAVVAAAFGQQSLFAVSEDGAASIVRSSSGGPAAEAVLPEGTATPDVRVAFYGNNVILVNPTGRVLLGELSSGRWLDASIAWDSAESLRGVAVNEGIGVVATDHTLFSFAVTRARDESLQRIHFDTPIRSVALTGSLVALGSDNGIEILLADENGHLEKRSTLPTRYPVADISLTEQIGAAALEEGGVMLFDIAEPQVPLWLSRYSNIGRIERIYLSDERLLAVGDDGRYFVFDVGNASAPVVDQSFRGLQNSLAAGLSENQAWILGARGLEVWDISAAAPRLSNADLDAGQGVNYGGQRKAFFDADNQRLFVADWFSGIHIYDVADIRHPRLLSTFHTPGSPKGVVVRDNIAYIADDDHGLQVVDVADPRDPAQITTLELKGLAYTPVLDGSRLFVASHHGGFQVIDVSAPSQPRLLGEYDTPGKAWALAVKDHVLMVADSEGGLIGFNIEDVTQPIPIWEFNPGGHAEDILIDGEFAYAAFFDGSVYTLDVSDPVQASVIGQVRTPGNARGLAKRGTDLYIADWLAGVVKVDVTDPQAPALRDWLDTDGATWGLVRDGSDTLFGLDWWGGLIVLTDEENRGLEFAGRYNQFDAVQDVAVRENYLISAEGEYGIQIYDIKNPLNPTWSAGLELPGSARQVVVAGSRAFVADGTDQIFEVDLSDPFSPRRVGLVKAEDSVNSIKSDGATVAYRVGDNMLCAFDSGRAGLPRCKHFDNPIADFDVHRERIVVAAATRVWRWRSESFPDDIDATFAVDSEARFIRSHEGGIWLVTHDHRLGIYDDESRMFEPGDGVLPFDGANDMALLGNRAILAMPDGVRTLDVTIDGQSRSTDYSAGRPVSRLASRNGVVYGASARSIFAVSPIEAVAWSVTDGERVRLSLPAALPEGSYSVVATSGSRQEVFPNIIRRQLKGFGKPKITAEQFNELLEQKRAPMQDNVP